MAKSIGDKLSESESLNNLFDQVVSEVGRLGSSIQSVAGENPELASSSQEWISELEENRGRPLFYPYVGSGIGNGPYVELQDGSIKMDLINGIGINIFGHSHPRIIKAGLRGAIQDVVMQGNLQPGKEMVRFAKKIVELSRRNSRLNHSWITTSGSMAIENALNMCRQKSNGARMIVAMTAAFAGRTSMMAEITDNDTMRVGLPRYDEVLRIPFYDKNNPNSTNESLEQFKKHIEKHKGDICAFTFEPMQGEGGYNVAPREFFIPLLELCKEHGIPVWNDEIQTFCRTGQFFAYETLGIGEYIDVCTVAKTIQSGCTLYTDELNPQAGLIAGTFAGSSSALAAGLEILEIMDNEGYQGPEGKVQIIHNKFIGLLNELNETTCRGLLQDAGGLGLMCAVTPLDGSKEKMLELAKILYKNGLISFGCGRGPFRLRFLLPAVLEDKHFAEIKAIIEKSVLELA
ncbi:MAG: aminotransferase class III-fold pyridoxal phosphate-dependent enzyme [Bdellovibrionales bacterium]